MKAVVFHGVGDIRLDEVAQPKIKDDTDAIVRLTASAICGTDLHESRTLVYRWSVSSNARAFSDRKSDG